MKIDKSRRELAVSRGRQTLVAKKYHEDAKNGWKLAKVESQEKRLLGRGKGQRRTKAGKLSGSKDKSGFWDFEGVRSFHSADFADEGKRSLLRKVSGRIHSDWLQRV